MPWHECTAEDRSDVNSPQGTFSDLPELLEGSLQQPPENVADGILLDLGVSSMQAGAPKFSELHDAGKLICRVPSYCLALKA